MFVRVTSINASGNHDLYCFKMILLWWYRGVYNHWMSIIPYEIIYLSVRTSSSLKPMAFYLRPLNCLNQSLFYLIKSKKVAFWRCFAASFSYLRAFILRSSISSYLFLIYFSLSMSNFYYSSVSWLIYRGLQWTSAILFWRVSFVMI